VTHGAVLPELRPEHMLGPGVEEVPMEALTKTPMKPTSAMKEHLAAVKSRTKLAVRPVPPTNHTGREPSPPVRLVCASSNFAHDGFDTEESIGNHCH
jgi:hypothetical protein